MSEETLVKLTETEAEKQFPGPSEFVHLHNHTIFSLLDGVAQPDDYFRGCAQRKWPAFAVTEHGVMSSIPDSYFAAKEHGVKYIVGNEVYYNDYEPRRQEMVQKGWKIKDLKESEQESDRDLAQRISRNRHLTVLCKNMKGYENLLKLNKYAWQYGMYYKPRIWLDQLKKHHEGLIILSGCLNGPVCYELRNGNIKSKPGIMGAIEYVKQFKAIFGDDYYIELQMPGIPGDVDVFNQLVILADQFKLKIVIANDCHYIKREDFKIQKVMMAIDQDTTVDDPNLFHVNSDEQYFKTRAELRYTFATKGYMERNSMSVFERACDNTLEIADKCEMFRPNIEPKLPKIDNAKDTLVKLAYNGLREKGFDKDTRKYLIDGQMVTYKEQMMIELQRFLDKGFESYFLITRDLIKCSTDKGYPIGPARGSAGGSLVCYLIGIHSIDPIKWGLSFNRFLSPSRGGNMLKVTMPGKK